MKIGILGGGQLGKMFMQNALNYPNEIYFLEPDSQAPCSVFCDCFIEGDFKDYQTVLDFGEDKDILSIEIENVNIEALKELQKNGKKIIPNPECLQIIKDKGLQKEFYREHYIPTANFYLVENKGELKDDKGLKFPFIQKLRIGGYDGKGVQLIKNQFELDKFWNKPSVIEEVIDIEKELSVIVSKNENGEVNVFNVVEMVFNEKLNLVDCLFSPADISNEVAGQVKEIGRKAVDAFQTPGIFCIELFLSKNGKLMVNEIAPRVHNSGHQTIEANYSSQYDQMFRVLTNSPLGDVSEKEYAAMINLVGEAGYIGEAKYEGLEKLLDLSKVYLHLYGKKITNPGRKMGHVTVLGHTRTEIKQKIQFIKNNLKVIS